MKNDRILCFGDAHGSTAFVRLALDVAARHNISVAVSVGDFGFWPTGQRFVKECRDYARSLGIVLFVVDGNHDFPGEGRRFDGGFRGYTAPTTGLRLDDAILDEPELWHLQRGSRIEIAGSEICFVGGAVSIDRSTRTVGEDWWPSEALTQQEADRIVADGRADLVVSHDSTIEPPGTRPVTFPGALATDLKDQRQRMSQIVGALKPKLHVHGHWHLRYSANVSTGPVLGLDYESVRALHAIDLARLTHHAARLGLRNHAHLWWLDTLDHRQQVEALNELAMSNYSHAVVERYEQRALGK